MAAIGTMLRTGSGQDLLVANPNLNPNSNPDLKKLGWHDTQVMPDPKLLMRDSTVHSVSVVIVVSERQGEKKFQLNTDRSVSTKYR